MAIEVTKPVVLIVEGQEDKSFFSALIRHTRLENIQVEGIGGKTELPRQLNQLSKSRGFLDNTVSLGIIRDADENAGGAFQSVCSALQHAQLPIPRQVLETQRGSPHVTVMILPGNNAPGMLEDICLLSVAQDPAIACLDQYFDCLSKQEGINYPHNISKARVHAFLASRDRADLRLGEAAQRGYWPWNHSAFDQVKSFLQQIISI